MGGWCVSVIGLYGMPPLAWLNLRVREYWDAAGRWELDGLHCYLDATMLHKISCISLLDNKHDTWSWQAASSDLFSSSSAATLLHKPVPDVSTKEWKQLWNFKGPTRASMTLWLLQHERLPSADIL